MKKILLALTLMVAAVSYGQTEKGKWMIGSNVGLNFSSSHETTKKGSGDTKVETKATATTFNFSPDASYFLANNLALGIGLDYKLTSVKDGTTTNSFGIMPNIKYFFPQGQIAPFVGLGVGYRMDSSTPKVGDSTTKGGLAARVEGGLAYFLTPSLAATASVKYDYTSVTHSNDSNHQIQTGLLNVGIGVAYFF